MFSKERFKKFVPFSIGVRCSLWNTHHFWTLLQHLPSSCFSSVSNLTFYFLSFLFLVLYFKETSCSLHKFHKRKNVRSESSRERGQSFSFPRTDHFFCSYPTRWRGVITWIFFSSSSTYFGKEEEMSKQGRNTVEDRRQNGRWLRMEERMMRERGKEKRWEGKKDEENQEDRMQGQNQGWRSRGWEMWKTQGGSSDKINKWLSFFRVNYLWKKWRGREKGRERKREREREEERKGERGREKEGRIWHQIKTSSTPWIVFLVTLNPLLSLQTSCFESHQAIFPLIFLLLSQFLFSLPSLSDFLDSLSDFLDSLLRIQWRLHCRQKKERIRWRNFFKNESLVERKCLLTELLPEEEENQMKEPWLVSSSAR